MIGKLRGKVDAIGESFCILDVNGVKICIQRLDGADPKSLRGLSDKIKAEVGSGLVFLAAPGAGKLSFVLAANSGEVRRPLARIASGGELSRVALAIKSVVAAADTTPTLVFDEVDSGIVGSVIDVRDPHELVTFSNVLFIDRGAEDSVHLGDIFQISGTTTAASDIGRVVQNEVKALV